jgi:hypothetical protein
MKKDRRDAAIPKSKDKPKALEVKTRYKEKKDL